MRNIELGILSFRTEPIEVAGPRFDANLAEARRDPSRNRTGVSWLENFVRLGQVPSEHEMRVFGRRMFSVVWGERDTRQKAG